MLVDNGVLIDYNKREGRKGPRPPAMGSVALTAKRSTSDGNKNVVLSADDRSRRRRARGALRGTA